ncbi:TlpA family protein disulfide reductase [Ohtaekwangia koreensis]|uniref:Thiol-disulfide isomerase or thioredoxin n=1 Tax=Ohtaekwangia koreensis TaxID=688867 RepID=A0A1T5M5L1_9BACT|nr:TlpA disulfide reductase family protein [Ohtaekwangia koreensis]SKC83108.1 Thiol-disulfide isomerase or thioredoxin [Ohtaekwangia koreensis]
MKNILKNPRTASIFKMIRPWITLVALILVLRYTGILAGISVITNTAMMRTGVLDADSEPLELTKDFDYNFSITDLENKKVDFNQFKGKTVFLNLWATWCGPCRVEMPSIQKLYNEVNHDDIVFVMLSLDRAEDKEKVVKFVNDKQHTFPVYVPAGYLPEQLNVSSIPTTFIISPEGKIVSKKVGTANYDTEEFKTFLEKL